MKLEDNSIINENMISDLDDQINYLNQDLEPLKEFILPSGDHFHQIYMLPEQLPEELKDRL